MPKKPLIETNPYLKDSKRRQVMLRLSVISSTAVEGVHLTPNDLRPRKCSAKKKTPTGPRASRRVKHKA